MKKFKNDTIKTIQGKPFRIPDTNSDDEPIIVDGKPKMKDARLSELLRLLVFNLPLQQLTMKDSIEAQRLFEQMSKSTDGHFSIEDAEHKWIKGKVEDIGPQILGVSAVMVQEALDSFERLHEPKEKKVKEEATA